MLDPSKILHDLPSGLRQPLVAAYEEIARNFSEHRWEPAELNGGKLCEIVYTIIHGAITGTYPTTPSKPPRLVDACRALEQQPVDPNRVADRSLRILLPRLLPYLYEIRNNRNVGHVGGDVDPNFSDASAVLACSKWIMAELVRIFHQVSLEEAQATVDMMVERKHVLVWEVGELKRILVPAMPKKDQILVLLYSSSGWLPEKHLRKCMDDRNSTNFRTRFLKPLHRERKIEYDVAGQRTHLSPLGTKDVEDRILPAYT